MKSKTEPRARKEQPEPGTGGKPTRGYLEVDKVAKDIIRLHANLIRHQCGQPDPNWGEVFRRAQQILIEAREKLLAELAKAKAEGREAEIMDKYAFAFHSPTIFDLEQAPGTRRS